MSIVAVVPVANLADANATLEELGFGPNNFSVPAYGGTGATHAALHCWPNTPFSQALDTIPGVIKQEGPLQIGIDGEGNPILIDDPVSRTKTLIEAQGAKWGAQAPELPSSGTVTAGSLYRYGEDELWSVIQSFNRSVYGAHPSTYPALIRRVRNPYVREPWSQPLDQFDAYKLVNPFTGQPSECTHNGQDWYVSAADGSGNNVWEPGIFGWTVIGEEAPTNPGDPPGSETWIDTGATVTGQAGQLYYISQPISNLGLVAGQSIKLGNSETTYVSTWPGTNNLMQINPFVTVAVGAKVWRWE